MTPTVPTPPSTASSSNPHSPDVQHRVVRKRNRVPLSCAPCRHRKLKCNRSHPCDNCIKRSDANSCTYAAPGARRRTTGNDGHPTTPDEMQNRIDRLESLVLSLMTNGSQADGQTAAQAAISGAQSATSTEQTQEMDQDDSMLSARTPRDDDSEVEHVSKSMGIMKVMNDRNVYASEAHWFAILSDIAEVKSYFADHKKQYDEQAKKVKAYKGTDDVIGTSMMFKGTAKVDRNELMSNFPPRHIANELISRYFETENPATHIIHRPTYCKQYERHWAFPQSTSITWLGMSYAMMCLALQSYHRAGGEPQEYRGRAWEHSLRYLDWTSQCLVHADFTQPIIFMVETLCLYLQAEHARTRDAETGVWILSGIVARLAMRMGLHRDPRPYASLSPYQGEMRRRMWAFVRSADILMSYQCGMPSLIKSVDCDTPLPTNIRDDEFDEDTKVLPPSRPLSESTGMSFMIVDCHLTFVLGKILEESSALTAMSYETAMQLDNELREVKGTIPATLLHKSREESALDSSSIIMQRYTLDLLYQKGMCALHRKFLSRARESPRFAYSRRTCVEACLQMLKQQQSLHSECQPGGRLHSIPWSVTSALAQHDFLLAAMVICLDLYHTASAEAKGQTSGEMYAWATERREEMFAAIEASVAIWESLRDQSMEAYKASAVLTVMLEKLKNHTAIREQLSKNFSFIPQSNGTPMDQGVAPEHSAAMTLGMMSSGLTPDVMSGMYDRSFPQQQRTGLTPQPPGMEQQQGGMTAPQAQMDGAMQLPANFFGQVGGFQGLDQTPQNLDWDAWDTYIQGTNMDTSGQGMVFDPAFTSGELGQSQAGSGDGKVQTSQLGHMYGGNGAYGGNGVTSQPQAGV